ncbi:hypothetical protein ACIBAC_00065 [Streptomyces sp. NPDC051362]|uniref:hypothetical protein n=1 Tax=Streptomyces sp. NPDC051362 TaxID=3365651 RepID=UPI0037B8399A
MHMHVLAWVVLIVIVSAVVGGISKVGYDSEGSWKGVLWLWSMVLSGIGATVAAMWAVTVIA